MTRRATSSYVELRRASDRRAPASSLRRACGRALASRASRPGGRAHGLNNVWGAWAPAWVCVTCLWIDGDATRNAYGGGRTGAF